MKKTLLTLALLIATQSFYAQIRVGLESNNQYYLDDDKIKIDPKEAKDPLRSNTYLKVDYSLDNWEFGIQGESYLPKAILNYNDKLQNFNVGTVYTRYNNANEGIDLTLGHFYEQFGSGLILRSWEDRALGINNALFGVKSKFNFIDNIDLTLVSGKQRIGMGFDLSEGYINGGNLDFNLSNALGLEENYLKLGFSYVGRFQDIKEKLDRNAPFITNAYSIRADYSYQGFYIGSEYIYKDKDNIVEGEKIFGGHYYKGNALLINTGITGEQYAFNTNLRYLENMTFYSNRNLNGGKFNAGTINYVPSLVKQYDYSLQNIYVYQAQSNLEYYSDKMGEMGGQFDFYYDFEEGSALGGEHGTHIALNGSYWGGIKNTREGYNITAQPFKDGLGISQKYYTDLGVEVRKKWSEKFQMIAMYLNQFYNKGIIEGGSAKINTHIASAEGTYFFAPTNSMRLEIQHMNADADRKNWAAATLEYTPNSMLSFYISDMYNYGTDNPNEKLHYYNIGGSYTYRSTRFTLNYGRQRGGLVCVGGVCRYVPESNGFSVGLTSNF